MISRDKAAEYAKLLQAFSEGKEVQQKWYREDGWGHWDGTFPDDIQSDKWQFRIKPETRKAREFWVSEHPLIGFTHTFHAFDQEGCRGGNHGLIHVREVLPEDEA